ncbi:MAG: hypothetical protein KC729_08835 [Candidatus Eisenbacteria bacterium]|uniref:Gliding motility protein SprA N-terminal domain-containing protein n=1 Tax=Eiseniibacteriota bacterium TaxID=2212470 RepID=A0A956LY81_UNCEI|nr:hypothetical protein [Candidatus Eisenbacteria bacterium]
MSGHRVVDADSLRYQLPRGWIDPSTFVLRRGETTLSRGIDFLLDPRRGTLRLLRGFETGDTVSFRYRAFPLAVLDEYRLHRPYHGADSTQFVVETPLQETDDASFGRLQIAGSKTFSVEVGSQQDLALKQSLDLNVRGMIGKNVRVNAVLTDRDTPLQPEGTSTQLDELDRVLVEVEGPRARMTLGDYLLQLPPSDFARFQRQLKGVQGEVRPESVRLFAAGASSPGEFRSVEFLGVEGKQGPYDLGENNATVTVPVVAGSETVWLEGRRLTRGEDADYIIDYAEGTLTFTGRDPITAYSRIAVDYQLAVDSYARTVYSASIGAGASPDPDALAGAGDDGFGGPGSSEPTAPSRFGEGGPGLSVDPRATGNGQVRSGSGVRATWIVERDDRHDPLGLPFSEEQLAALREAGDRPSDALRSGIVFVGPGLGSYDQVFVDTLATAFFVYTGPDSGSYEVRFEPVGENEGTYSDTTDVDGTPYYVFVGEKNGDFVPGREIARPQSTAILAVAGITELGAHLGLRSEVAVSDHDANTFSSRDDGDNQGVAASAELVSRGLSLGGSRLRLAGRWRQVDARFRSLDRLNPSYYALDWNVDPARLEMGDRRFGFDTTWEAARTRLVLSLESLENRKDFDARRATLDAGAQRGHLDLAARVLRAFSHDTSPESAGRGLRARDQVRVTWLGPWVSTEGRYRHEETRQGTGDERRGSFYHESAFRLGSGRRWEALRLSMELTRRDTYSRSGARSQLQDIGRTGSASAEWRRPGGSYLAGSFTRRELEPKDERPRVTSDLGQVRWLERAGDGLFQQETRLELSTAVERRRIERIEFVGESAGHYDSLGVYQGIGDYEVFLREESDPSRVQRIDASFRTEADLSRRGDAEGPWLRRALSTARLVHSWTARIETERPTSYLWPRVLPVLLGRRALSLVDVRMRADLSLLPAARWASPRLTGEERRFSRAPTSGLREESLYRLFGLRLRSRPAQRWSADLEIERDRDQRTVTAATGGGRTGWTSTRVASEHEVGLWRRLSGLLRGSGRWRDRIGGEESAVVSELSPALVFSPQSRGRIELRTTRTWVERRAGSGRASRDLEVPGWVSRAVATVQLRDALDLSFSFRETRPDDGRTIRDARTELRATF